MNSTVFYRNDHSKDYWFKSYNNFKINTFKILQFRPSALFFNLLHFSTAQNTCHCDMVKSTSNKPIYCLPCHTIARILQNVLLICIMNALCFLFSVDRVVHLQFLQSMILNQENKVTVYPSIVTFSGLPNSGSSIALQKILGTPVETETSAIIGFSHHSIIATGYKQPSKIYCAEVDNTTSNLYCFQSGLQNSLFHQQESPVFNDVLEQNMLTFNDPALSDHILEVYETCKDLCTTVNEAVQEKQSRLHALKKKLPGGVATINVWDLAINRAIHTFLEIFSGQFHRHHMWLFLSLDRDADKLHEPPESDVFSGALRDSKAKIWRSRLHCLLRSSKLSDSVTPRNRKMCTLFAIHTSSQDAGKEKIKILQSECENAAHQFEVSDLIDFNVIPVDLNESDSKKLLMEKFTELLQQLECHEIPLSWVFLCGSFKYHKSIFITRNELQKKAEECGIDNKSLRDLCIFFTSFGSIIDISIIDPRSEIIVIKPYQFLAQLNKLLNLGSKVGFSIADQYGLITEEEATSSNVFGDSGKVFMSILDSVGLVAKVSKNRIPSKYNIPDTNGPLFYKPFIRTTSQTTKCLENSIYLVNGVDAPPMIMEVEFTNQLLNLLSHSLFLPSCDMNVTVVQVVPPDIVGDPINIRVTYQGDIVEFNVSPCGQPNTANMDKVCNAIVEASYNIAKRRLARNAGNVKYHFAVTCARDKYPTVAFNIHHRQHILPNKKLCEECCKKKVHVDVHLQSWNRALTKVR